MDIQFNKINPSLGVVSITLRQSDYGPAVEKQLKHYAQTVRLKGFRLGAVPVDLIKKMHGSSILAEELYKMASASLKDYIVQERIPIFMEPLFMMPDQPIDLKHQDTFTFSYEIGIIQERSLVLDPNISVKEFEISDVDPKLVDEFLQGLQIVHGETVHLDESEPSAMLYGTLVDGTGEVGLDIRIAIMHVAEHLRDSLIGLNVGAQVTITEEVLKSHFPALLGVSFSQFTTFKKHASAWPATFTIDKIVRVLPAAIDATLFDLVLGQGVVSSENDFREAIAKIILFDKRTEARYAFHEALKKVLLEHNVVDLPEDFLKRWLTVNNPKATLKEVEDYYNTHEEDLKWEILLGTIVRQNNLAVTPSEIVDETKRAYVDYVHNNGLQVEMNDSTLHACALSFLQGEEGNQYYANLHNRLSRERAIDFIKKQISIVAETLTAQEFDVRK